MDLVIRIEMKKVFLVMCMALICQNIFSQKHMNFMGIPIDGNINSFCKQLAELGFIRDKENAPNNMYCFTGTFYGEDANVDVEYDPYTYVVHSVAINIIKKSTLFLYPIQRDILKAIEEKYKFKKELVNPELYQYDYYIFDDFDPIGLIQTFVIGSDTSQGAMLNITYRDVDNWLTMENRKNNDI